MMIENEIIFASTKWTRFQDTHSGGYAKEDWDYIFIQLSLEKAKEFFEQKFNRNPTTISCSCCGEDYFIEEFDSLEAASCFQRNCVFVYPIDYPKHWAMRKNWVGAQPRWIEGDGINGEQVPEGWVRNSCDLGYNPPYIPLEDYINNPKVLVISSLSIFEPFNFLESINGNLSLPQSEDC